MNDAEREAYLDRVIQRRLATDRAYLNAENAEEQAEREDEIRHIRMCRMNGVEILDKTDWKGQWIPLLVALGEEMWIENKRYLFSLIRIPHGLRDRIGVRVVLVGLDEPLNLLSRHSAPRWAWARSRSAITLFA